MLEATAGPSSSSSSKAALTPRPTPQNGVSLPKRKRRPAGTPDPDAEVISLSPKTLLESDRFVCEFCNQGFQREQNLQMHRRRHKVPWEVLKRPPEMPLAATTRKRVYVCPEPTCLHHDPKHALGDLVGIKKHYRRKHSDNKQWVCDKCSKGYAVQSDYKAHIKTCGTRGHCCDCGLVFSRVESFIEHQDACEVKRNNGTDTQPPPLQQAICSSTTPSTTTTAHSSDTNFSTVAPFTISLATISPSPIEPPNGSSIVDLTNHQQQQSCLELQLLPPSSSVLPTTEEDYSTGLSLSIGPCSTDQKNKQKEGSGGGGLNASSSVYEELKLAMDEKAYAEERRLEARRQTELAELEFASAKRIRKAAKDELEEAELLKEQSTKRISAIMLEITCHACKRKFSN
ncbi:unnamed protein product [Cuscuta epithymum]|uniref:C2H2-type domain-containing protein n=1 Tax=Cuscuta epithymum TaxID=186058 RepID=A0AAV0D998_9ASTE|nr:unnamed protein product [Cuscuta epithymum]